MEKSLAWSKATKGIWHGVLGYVLFSIIGGLLSAISSVSSTVSKVSEFAQSGEVSASAGIMDVLPIVASVVAAICVLLIISNLGKWRNVVDANDAAYVSRIRSAFILTVIAVIISALPIPLVASIIGGILCIIAFFMQMTAYSTLKNSQTMPAAAAKGMAKLFTYTILMLIATLLSFIPLLGIIGFILSIIAYIFMLVGWAKVGNSRI